MTTAQTISPTANAAAALGWLVQAGVDTAVDELPRRWLADLPVAVPAAKLAPVATPAPAAARTPAPRPAPAAQATADIGHVTTLAALAEAVSAFAHPINRRDLAPQLLTGNAESRVIILCDQPEAAGTPAATLRGRMLAAIGLDAGNCALLHRIPWPLTGGRAPRADEVAAFAPFAARALELVQPRAILALGQLAAGIAGDAMALASARGRWQDVAIGDRPVPLLASLHPRLLLTQPARKREAWADLQAFAARLEVLP